MSQQKFIVITPAKNEAQYIQKTIDSLVCQSVLPSAWAIVDDGSTDATASLAQEAARRHPWIQVVIRKDAGKRDVGYGDTAAFDYGLNEVAFKEYEILFKIDADVVLGPHYFREILRKFSQNPRLGIAVGEVDELFNDRLIRMKALPLAFNGMIKGWRRTCFEEIGGIPAGPGWDGIDCYKAMMLGWETTTFGDAALRVVHLRPEGSSIKNRYFGWARHGRALHFCNSHPVWVLASSFYHFTDRPFILGGLCMIIGYLQAWFNKAEQYGDAEFRRYVRHRQLQELVSLLKLDNWLGK